MTFTGSGGAAYSSERDDWETPRELFDRIDAIWHFTVDAASSDSNALCERHFTAESDGLSQDWGGERVWCNPPYGRGIKDWIRKGFEESRKPGTVVVMLVPARTDTAWYHDYVSQADEVAYLRGRLKFSGAESNAPFPSMLVRFGGALPNGR